MYIENYTCRLLGGGVTSTLMVDPSEYAIIMKIMYLTGKCYIYDVFLDSFCNISNLFHLTSCCLVLVVCLLVFCLLYSKLGR